MWPFGKSKAEDVVEAPRISHDQAVRSFVGRQPFGSHGMQVCVEYLLVPQVNRLRRHCRIGKIALKA